MDKHGDNLAIAQEFQEIHDLKDGYGNSHFDALVSFDVNVAEESWTGNWGVVAQALKKIAVAASTNALRNFIII